MGVLMKHLMKNYKNGEAFDEDKHNIAVGDYVLHKGLLHRVVDGGKEQGKRLACVRTFMNRYIGILDE